MRKCKECYYFRPYYGDGIPAACKHSGCFTPIKIQTRCGDVITEDHRSFDILDFNADGACERWISFHYEKVVRSWWIFHWTTKKKVKGAGEG